LGLLVQHKLSLAFSFPALYEPQTLLLSPLLS
jgi:hypothetical protein